MYPTDIDPQSGCRLPLPDRASLDPDAQAIFDSHVKGGGYSIRGLRGPGGLQLHSPELAKRKRPVGSYLRFEAGFSGRVRETAILITARCCDSQFEWAAHEDEALKEGVPKETIEAIKHDRPLDALDPTDALIVALGREIFRARKVASQTYERALTAFGARPLIDLVTLMGSYAATAALLTAFDMQLDPGVTPPLPPRRQGS
jgi:4-carboxymuconolactone decarboxylase